MIRSNTKHTTASNEQCPNDYIIRAEILSLLPTFFLSLLLLLRRKTSHYPCLPFLFHSWVSSRNSLPLNHSLSLSFCPMDLQSLSHQHHPLDFLDYFRYPVLSLFLPSFFFSFHSQLLLVFSLPLFTLTLWLSSPYHFILYSIPIISFFISHSGCKSTGWWFEW